MNLTRRQLMLQSAAVVALPVSSPSAAKSARAARARLRATNNRHRGARLVAARSVVARLPCARRIRASVRCIIAPAAAIDFTLPGFLS